MASFFTADDVAKLEKDRQDVRRQYRQLQGQYMARAYNCDRAREYAHNGFCRRLDCLARAVDFVFDILPPERDDIPDTDDVVAATMLIQSFVVNASGCLDNLAWIWVYETELRGKDGKAIDPKWVGLGESYRYVRNSFTKPFRNYLHSRKDWFRHLSEFRDALAHRIPLYIPPYIISDADAEKYSKLDRQCIEAMQRSDYRKYDELRAEQKALGKFRPWMNHSLTEKSPTIVFHDQLLQDYKTVDEIARKMLTELDRFDELTRRRAAPRKGHLRRFINWCGAIAKAAKRLFI